jgi:hypothetical protein
MFFCGGSAVNLLSALYRLFIASTFFIIGQTTHNIFAPVFFNVTPPLI